MANVIAMTPPDHPTVTVRTKMSEGGRKFRNKFNIREIEEIRNVPLYVNVMFEQQIEEHADDSPFTDLELAKFYMSLVKSKIDTSQINIFSSKIATKWSAALPKRYLNAAHNFAESEWSAMGIANDKAKGKTNVMGTFGFDDLKTYAYDSIKNVNDNYTPVLLRHGKNLVRVVRNPQAEREEMDFLSPRSLRPIVHDYAPFFVDQGGEMQSCSAPMDVVEELYYGNYTFPCLTQIATHPLFASDGDLISTNGYDEDTGIYMSLPANLRMLNIPRIPTQLDIDEALETLLDLFGDFPFDGEDCRPDGETLYADDVPASMANFLAMLLTPFCRQMIDGPLPMAFITKPKVATGASLLAEGAYRIVAGASEPSAALPSNEEERRKLIFASLRAPKPFMWFDNVSGEIVSDALASVLTATTFEGRILGQSSMATVAVNAMTIMTSNNARLNEDLKRRAFLIRLDAQMENPKARTTFKYSLEGGHIAKHREELLCAALTLVKAWVFAGMPAPQNAPHMASFGEWVRVLGGVLEHAGITTFLSNEDQKDRVASINEAEGINDLVAVWWEKANDAAQRNVSNEMLVGGDEGLVDLCFTEDIALEGVRKTKRDADVIYDATAMGKFLAQYADAYFNLDGVEVRLEKAGTRQRRTVWKLTPKVT
ncbi:hypothetical protein SAMN05444287_0901 [Octadecabacter temperatus]|uniref:Uncharacterized protein n=1 Tax=Octadecabacter temperatus TaxID=1458307 RepID=A0A0K0Y4P0_9RHOB|nr:hypothetical protein [Octadecabacter temperatus]AKS45802.1 hypothetical protein OSB_12470 [Octadecabacter temperatus]SIO00859.1 hypothetical protein SAMN05444287_0901 [Octadecabacter temperatus]